MARAPYCTVIDGSTCATAVPRAESVPVSPLYQLTVFAVVPATSVVATPSGGEPTRIGGWPKKLSPAVTADAATSGPLASAPIEVLSAALRLAAVAVELAPMAKLLAGSGVAVEAVSVMSSVVPSGRLKVNLTDSPSAGLVAPRSTDIAAGVPVGWVIVAPVSVEVIALSLRPNADGEASSAICTDVADGAVSTTRPRPLVPTSACLRSRISCLSPAWAPLPFMIASAEATGAVSVARPENR